MKKIIVISLLISSLSMVLPTLAGQQNHRGGKSLSADLSDNNQNDSQGGMGFSLNLKHAEAPKSTPSSIKPLQIFPVNTVTTAFTYSFS